MPKRPRSKRRALERATKKLQQAKRKLEGLSPERPLECASASIVESRAAAIRPCPSCDSPLRAVSHEAQSLLGIRLRVVGLSCPQCGERLTRYVKIAQPLPN